MELFFLGTGAGIPAKQRNVTSIALLMSEERNATWLFDCGEGTQHQILKSKIRPGKIEKIFVSHLHGDHIYGLPGLLSSRSFQGGETPLTIYGPKGVREFVEVSLRTSGTHLRYALDICEIDEGTVFQDKQFKVSAFKLHHGLPSYGYRIEEADRSGALNVRKLQEMGIPPGPIYKQIKSGEEVVLDDGRVIDGKAFTFAPIKGKILAIAGDTRKCENTRQLAMNADWLVHESTFQLGQEQLAYEFFHTTNTEAATIAKEAGVKNLVLTHISSRFTEADMVQFLQEAKEIFPNCKIASDFSCFDL